MLCKNTVAVKDFHLDHGHSGFKQDAPTHKYSMMTCCMKENEDPDEELGSA